MGKLIFNAQSIPVAPVGENKHTMFVDSCDGKLKIEDSAGNICEFSSGYSMLGTGEDGDLHITSSCLDEYGYYWMRAGEYNFNNFIIDSGVNLVFCGDGAVIFRVKNCFCNLGTIIPAGTGEYDCSSNSIVPSLKNTLDIEYDYKLCPGLGCLQNSGMANSYTKRNRGGYVGECLTYTGAPTDTAGGGGDGACKGGDAVNGCGGNGGTTNCSCQNCVGGGGVGCICGGNGGTGYNYICGGGGDGGLYGGSGNPGGKGVCAGGCGFGAVGIAIGGKGGDSIYCGGNGGAGCNCGGNGGNAKCGRGGHGGCGGLDNCSCDHGFRGGDGGCGKIGGNGGGGYGEYGQPGNGGCGYLCGGKGGAFTGISTYISRASTTINCAGNGGDGGLYGGDGGLQYIKCWQSQLGRTYDLIGGGRGGRGWNGGRGGDGPRTACAANYGGKGFKGGDGCIPLYGIAIYGYNVYNNCINARGGNGGRGGDGGGYVTTSWNPANSIMCHGGDGGDGGDGGNGGTVKIYYVNNFCNCGVNIDGGCGGQGGNHMSCDGCGNNGHTGSNGLPGCFISCKIG